MARSVVFSPEARDDLFALYDHIAAEAGPARALAYIGRIETACRRLEMFPERGQSRDDLRPGLRVIGFERRAVIALHVDTERVTILRILHGGRDVDLALS